MAMIFLLAVKARGMQDLCVGLPLTSLFELPFGYCTDAPRQ